MTRRRLFERKLAPNAKAPAARTMQDAVEAAALDDASRRFGERLGASQSVIPIAYKRERRGRWLIEHGRAGDDYVFQLHPLKALSRSWQDITSGFIGAMDAVFPRTVQLQYRRPDENWEIGFFTIAVEKVCRLPGWEQAIDRAIDALGAIETSATPRSSSDHLPPTGKRGGDDGAG